MCPTILPSSTTWCSSSSRYRRTTRLSSSTAWYSSSSRYFGHILPSSTTWYSSSSRYRSTTRLSSSTASSSSRYLGHMYTAVFHYLVLLFLQVHENNQAVFLHCLLFFQVLGHMYTAVFHYLIQYFSSSWYRKQANFQFPLPSTILSGECLVPLATWHERSGFSRKSETHCTVSSVLVFTNML
jgi:hypothetical protein